MIEAWGRGFEKIREACEKYDGPLPEYEINEDGIMVLCKACNAYLCLLNDGHKLNQNGQDVVKMLVKFCKEPKTVQEMMEYIGEKSRTSFKRKYLKGLVEDGTLKMTIPDKPTSGKQKYFS